MHSAFGVEDSRIAKAYGRTPTVDAARWGLGVAGAGTAGGGTVYTSERRKGRSKTNARRNAEATVLGGIAGQGAYQGTGYAAKHKALAEYKASGMSNSQRDKKLKAVKAEHGKFTAEMFRNYPKDLPGAKINRTMGWSHRGKTGTATGAALTVGGALAARRASQRENS